MTPCRACNQPVECDSSLENYCCQCAKVIHTWQQKIPLLDHTQMATLWRFAPSGHPCFDTRFPLFELFEERFKELGGMTPVISKEIGWQ